MLDPVKAIDVGLFRRSLRKVSFHTSKLNGQVAEGSIGMSHSHQHRHECLNGRDQGQRRLEVVEYG
jgi:hypothetical protein